MNDIADESDDICLGRTSHVGDVILYSKSPLSFWKGVSPASLNFNAAINDCF